MQDQPPGGEDELDRSCSELLRRLVERMPEDWAEEEALRSSCAAEVERHCPYTPSGRARLHQCLRWGLRRRRPSGGASCAGGGDMQAPRQATQDTAARLAAQADGGDALLEVQPARRGWPCPAGSA